MIVCVVHMLQGSAFWGKTADAQIGEQPVYCDSCLQSYTWTLIRHTLAVPTLSCQPDVATIHEIFLPAPAHCKHLNIMAMCWGSCSVWMTVWELV